MKNKPRILKFLETIKTELIWLGILSPAIVFLLTDFSLERIRNPFILIYLLIGAIEWICLYVIFIGAAISGVFNFIKEKWTLSRKE